MSLILSTLALGLLLMIIGVGVMFVEGNDKSKGAVINEVGLAITIVSVLAMLFGYGV